MKRKHLEVVQSRIRLQALISAAQIVHKILLSKLSLVGEAGVGLLPVLGLNLVTKLVGGSFGARRGATDRAASCISGRRRNRPYGPDDYQPNSRDKEKSSKQTSLIHETILLGTSSSSGTVEY